ncbi:MAG: DUF3857 domain-containing protein [Candidatus Latescibacterota bacterium]|nr:MAG: DUF3857 domain-containing protein [Candidatus Latescibacterota bacterium]
MSRLRMIIWMSAAVLFTLVAARPIAAYADASMGTSGGHDLDELWSHAQQQFDLTTEDAVLLLESRQVSIRANGNLHTRVHRVVWIGAGVSIRGQADLRIPYNSATSTLTVNKLRTWRDDRWWPDTGVSETAVVETLPYAVARADDYTTMRETMLLHDGVELPCIMETDYEIVERGAAAYGTDDLWIFTQDDPAVRVELVLDVSQGESPVFHSGNGAPEPEITRGTNGRDVHRWVMENVSRMGMPRISDPAIAEPYVAWSTWRDWGTLGDIITMSFDEAAVLNQTMSDTLAARLENEPTDAAKARAIVALVDEFARSIHYDSRFWRFSPRTTSRTWETAYGHAIDRAALATALFRGAGLEASPMYRSISVGGIDQDVPGLSRFGNMLLLVRCGAAFGCYDPDSGSFDMTRRALRGCALWRPDSPRPPHVNDPEPVSLYELTITMQPDDKAGWKGTGIINANNLFSPYDDMVGFGGEALAYIGRVAASAIDGAAADAFNPEFFDAARVTGGFGFHVDDIEPDSHGRTVIKLNAPAGGVTARLPSDVHLYREKRTSPVILPGPMTQRITLRVKTGDRKFGQIPEGRVIENKAGSYSLNATHKDGWITIKQELTLSDSIVPPEQWRDLRTLLLEAEDPVGQTIFLE